MNLPLHLRSRVETPPGSGQWNEVTRVQELPAREAAILICDMWDQHWCRSAARRCDEIAHRMAPVIEAARARGVTIIHAPSDCMEFYQDTPQRRRMIDVPYVEPPPPRQIDEPPLPIEFVAQTGVRLKLLEGPGAPRSGGLSLRPRPGVPCVVAIISAGSPDTRR